MSAVEYYSCNRTLTEVGLFADVNFHFLELFTRKSYEYCSMFPNMFNVITGTKGNYRLSIVVE